MLQYGSPHLEGDQKTFPQPSMRLGRDQHRTTKLHKAKRIAVKNAHIAVRAGIA